MKRSTSGDGEMKIGARLNGINAELKKLATDAQLRSLVSIGGTEGWVTHIEHKEKTAASFFQHKYGLFCKNVN